jgi:hypothetical protein
MPAGGRADDRAMIVSGSPGGYAARRVLAGIVALPFTGYALLALAGLLRPRFEPIGTMLFLVSATWAALLWWFALRGHIEESRAHMRVTLIGGFVIGGIAFAAGFFGPIVFTPEANQGPLLGIFVTGPLGFVVGVAGGWLYGHTRRHPPDGLARAA